MRIFDDDYGEMPAEEPWIKYTVLILFGVPAFLFFAYGMYLYLKALIIYVL